MTDIKNRIAFKGMERSVALESLINDKMEKVTHLLQKERGPIFIDVVLNTEHGKKICDAEVRINGPHFSLVATSQEREMYLAVEKAIDTMAAEVDKMRKKNRDAERKANTFKGA